MPHSRRITKVVIASKAKRSRLWDYGGRLVWIASLSLAMTTKAVAPNCSLLSIAAGETDE